MSLTEYQIYQHRPDLRLREQNFFRRRDLRPMFAGFEDKRRMVLPALQIIMADFFQNNAELLDSQAGTSLEIGSGNGFFSRFLMQDKPEHHFCLDLNPHGLLQLQQTAPELNPTQATAYFLPLASASLDRIIGYSAFDSMLYLEKAVAEVARALRPQGQLVLFQDVGADLHNPGIEPSVESVEIYHQELVRVVSKQTDLKILKGESDCLEGIAVEPWDHFRKRCKDLPAFDENTPVKMTLWERGEFKAIPYSDDVPSETYYQAHQDYAKPSINCESILHTDPTDVIHWVRLRYLLSQKI